MTSPQYRYLVQPKPVLCPYFSVFGGHNCNHCGDNNGLNAPFRKNLQSFINDTVKSIAPPTPVFVPETKDNVLADRVGYVNRVQTTTPGESTTPSIVPAPSPSGPSKAKPRGRPALKKPVASGVPSLLPKTATNKKNDGDPSAAGRMGHTNAVPYIQPDLAFTGPFEFLDLPHHVRHMIYVKLIKDTGSLQKPKDPSGRRLYHQPPITRANRSIRRESLYLVYSLNPAWAGSRDLCKSGPAFIKAIGEVNCRLIRKFVWYTARRTLNIEYQPDGIQSNVHGNGPKGEERSKEICDYLNRRPDIQTAPDQRPEQPIGLGVADFEHITAIVLRSSAK